MLLRWLSENVHYCHHLYDWSHLTPLCDARRFTLLSNVAVWNRCKYFDFGHRQRTLCTTRFIWGIPLPWGIGNKIRDWEEAQSSCSFRNQSNWFRYQIRMPPGFLLVEVFQTHSAGRRPKNRPRTRLRVYISHLVWESLQIPEEKQEGVAKWNGTWVTLQYLAFAT